jgi:hypothetical protein
MKDYKPLEISIEEWAEILEISGMFDFWDCHDESCIKEKVYGVKFNFVSENRNGYLGDLYLLQSAESHTLSPITVIREDGKLKVVENPNSPCF